MSVGATARDRLLALALVGAGGLVGALTAASPAMAVALVLGVLLVAFPFAFPVAHLVTLIGITALVPYSIQNTYSLGGGGAESPGVLLADVLLLTGLLRAMVVLARSRLKPVSMAAMALTLVFLALAFLQFLAGLRAGADISRAGDELRRLLGYTVLLIAYPVVLVPAQRARLLGGLLAIGLLLGIWGLVQWTFPAVEAVGPEFGVRQGVGFTSGGRGQLQGGLYAFPVAVILGVAVLLAGAARSTAVRALVALAVALNVVCLLLTFERTFWAITLLGCLFVVVRSTPRMRVRAVLAAPIAIVCVLLPLATFAPNTLTTARERLLSLGQHARDDSVAARLVEYDAVLGEIRKRPLTGSGLGASVWYGWPARDISPSDHYFSHNAYLWLGWKVGVPAAVFLLVVLGLAIIRRRVGEGDPTLRTMCIAAQAALLASCVASVTFPALAAREITATIGLLLAFAAVPAVATARRTAPGTEPHLADHVGRPVAPRLAHRAAR
jgi:O-antigen ligase